MCMRYETAAISFHEEDGDFSLWTVDMPSEIVDEARKTADLHQESLLEIMELTPTVNGPTDTCLHFLFENEGQFSLCTMNMDKAFLWDYQHEGSSVRGSREDIVEELGDFFYCQAATPEEVMM